MTIFHLTRYRLPGHDNETLSIGIERALTGAIQLEELLTIEEAWQLREELSRVLKREQWMNVLKGLHKALPVAKGKG